MRLSLVAVFAATVALSACGSSDDDARNKPPPKKEGRAETQNIRNVQAVGINGKAIADKVDEALNKNEQQKKDTDKQAEEQTQ